MTMNLDIVKLRCIMAHYTPKMLGFVAFKKNQGKNARMNF